MNNLLNAGINALNKNGGNQGGNDLSNIASSFLGGNKSEGGNGGGNFDIGSLASQFLSNNNHEEGADAEKAASDHEEAYNKNNASNMSAKDQGAAAAMQAFKSFVQGGGNQNGQISKSQIVEKAIFEAKRLASNGSSSGNENDAMKSAAQTAVKLFFKYGGANHLSFSQMASVAKFLA